MEIRHLLAPLVLGVTVTACNQPPQMPQNTDQADVSVEGNPAATLIEPGNDYHSPIRMNSR